MSFYIYFDVNEAQFAGAVALLSQRLSSAGLALFLKTVVDPFIRNRIEQRFTAEGDDVTGKWHPLTVATALIRAEKGFPPDHPINVRTGYMRRFLVNTPSDVRPAGPMVTLTHPPSDADGLMALKLSTAQAGKSRPQTPARPVMGLNTNDALFITSELTAYLIA